MSDERVIELIDAVGRAFWEIDDVVDVQRLFICGILHFYIYAPPVQLRDERHAKLSVKLFDTFSDVEHCYHYMPIETAPDSPLSLDWSVFSRQFNYRCWEKQPNG